MTTDHADPLQLAAMLGQQHPEVLDLLSLIYYLREWGYTDISRIEARLQDLRPSKGRYVTEALQVYQALEGAAA